MLSCYMVLLVGNVIVVESVEVKSLSFLRSKAIPMLSPEKCATLANAPPSEPILEKERCSLCELIVENSRQWNWVGHYSSMCEGVPPHAQEWCEYYACKLAECGFFRSNTCKVINSVDQKDVVQMNPCPAKYLCSYCLQIPRTQVFGCLPRCICDTCISRYERMNYMHM